MTTPIFRGMIHDQVSPLTSSYQELFLSMSSLNHRLRDKRAITHAMHGIGRRLSILRVNLCHILRLSDRPKSAPLHGELQNELGMHLNSFYIHLHGLLDNIAWMLAYELNLFGPISEDEADDRRRIGLFRNDYRKMLKNESTLELLARHARWYTLTKQLRDPIAHRVPMYAVPCMLSHDDALKFQQLEEEEMQALTNGDLQRSQTLHMEKLQLGEYHPVLCHEQDGKPTLCPIREQVEHDSAILAEILWHFIEDEKTTQQ